MGKTYKDNPSKWRRNKPQKPWKKQKGNPPKDGKPNSPFSDPIEEHESFGGA